MTSAEVNPVKPRGPANAQSPRKELWGRYRYSLKNEMSGSLTSSTNGRPAIEDRNILSVFVVQGSTFGTCLLGLAFKILGKTKQHYANRGDNDQGYL